MDLLEQIERQVRARPEHPAHVVGASSLSYRDLWERSDALAAHLIRELPDDRSAVVVRGHKEHEAVISFLACAKARHPYVPVDASTPEARVQTIVRTSGARLILEATALPRHDAAAVPDPSRRAKGDDVLYVLFTSGSTGEPKGVQITVANLADFMAWIIDLFALGAGDEVFLNQAPFTFDMSVQDMYSAWLTGTTVFSLERRTFEHPRRLAAAFEGSGVTDWLTTPSFATMCLADKGFSDRRLPKMRRFILGGEPVTPNVVRALRARFPNAQVWNLYGPTEATAACTGNRVTDALLERFPVLPVGVAKPGTRVLVVDEALRPVPEGERGEILIIGPNVSPGYMGAPEQTARAFVRYDGEHAYRSGDWGRYREGLLFCEGRMDFQVKIAGNRVDLGDIEAHLRLLPGVEDAVVIPSMKDGVAQWLCAFVLYRGPPAADAFAQVQTLKHAVGERLPAYMVPQRVVFLDAFPMNSSGKACRKQLTEKLAEVR